MNLAWWDWAIMICAVIGLRYVSLSTKSRVKGVADFLSANRLAGRYLLSIASWMGSMGAIGFIAWFEIYWTAGLCPIWWSFAGALFAPIFALTGWIFYRFRETRALTMAQFFEQRYSRHFRIFAGFICWACGILNFGLFPAVAARLMMYFCGLPDYFHLPGIPFLLNTYATFMIVDLGLALMFVIMGGQVSVMVTECVQGMISNVAFIVVIIAVLLKVHWSQITAALMMAPADASMLHPFQTSKVPDFNFWYYLIGFVGATYTFMSWQGSSGFSSAAKSPHERRMGGIISTWRLVPQHVLMPLLPIAAFAVMKLPEFAAQAAAVNAALQKLPSDTLRTHYVVPIVLSHLLPVGVKGLFALTILFFSFTCHDTYMHSWGTIFIQDVVLPLRKKPLSPEQHIKYLRWSIAFVALFAFCFSLLYVETTKIIFFQAITGVIWLGGSGAVIIGGLYWARGTTMGAYTALIVGALLGSFGMFANPIWQRLYRHDFPINGQWLLLIGMVSAATSYVVVSLLTGALHKAANLEKLLHRGPYAAEGEAPKALAAKPSKWKEITGLRAEFTFTDKILAIAMSAWGLAWFSLFLVVTAVHFTIGTSVAWWAKFWHFYILFNACLAIPVTVWFTIGGIADIRSLFQALANAKRDATDDGRVVHEAGDVIEVKAEKPAEGPAGALAARDLRVE